MPTLSVGFTLFAGFAFLGLVLVSVIKPLSTFESILAFGLGGIILVLIGMVCAILSFHHENDKNQLKS